MRRTKYPTVMRGDFLDLSDAGHDIWMRENNPDGWDDATWKAFSARCRRSESFKTACQIARAIGNPRPHPDDYGWEPTRGGDVIELDSHRGASS